MFILVVALCLTTPALGDDAGQMNSAGTLYSKSVDLANAGNYHDALEAADQALALNVTSTIPLIQANRAGILTMLGRYEEAIAAADVAIADTGNIPTTKSIAWFNKGNALKSLGRISEARVAYDAAHTLDSSLPIPELTVELTISGTPVATMSTQSPTQIQQHPVTTTKTPLSPIIAIAGLMVALVCWRRI